MVGIDRINGPDMISGTTGINSRRVESQGSTEAGGFALPKEDGDGVIYEPSESVQRAKPKTLAETRDEIAREEAARAAQNMHARFDGPGVEVQLSSQAVKQASEQQARPETLFDILADVFRGVRDFFRAFWIGPDGDMDRGVNQDANRDADRGAERDVNRDAYRSVNQDVNRDADRSVNREVNRGEQAESDTPVSDSESEEGADVAVSAVDYMSDSTQKMQNDPESIAAFMVNYGGRQLAKNSDLLTQYDRNGHIVSPSASDRRRILQGEGRIRRY